MTDKMADLKKDLKFIILPGASPDHKYLNYYNEAYKCWHEVWGAAYEELGIDKTLYSDDFTRQTEIDCIFYKNECAGLLFMIWADLDNSKFRDDSYFKIWNDLDIAKLTKHGKKVLICSQTTVSPKFRRSGLGFSMKDLVFYLNYRRFKFSGADAMTGVMRRARGVHELGYRFGAVPLRTEVPHFNNDDLVDIVAIYKDTVSEGNDPFIIELGRHMFENKLIVQRQVVELPEENLNIFKKTG